MQNKRPHSKRNKKMMKGGEGETKNPNPSGWMGWLGVNNKKPDTGNNEDQKSVISTLTDKTNELIGRRQEGESEISHLQGEVEKMNKEKIDYEKKFKEDLQKMESTYEAKKAEDKKKLQDTFNSEMQKMDEKINNIKKKIQDVAKESNDNLNALQSKPQSGGRRTRRSVGHKSRAHRSTAHRSRARKEKKYTRKHRYSRKKRYY